MKYGSTVSENSCVFDFGLRIITDFYKMAVSVMKTTFPKAKPKVVQYRDYKNFNLQNFRHELRNSISHGASLKIFS